MQPFNCHACFVLTQLSLPAVQIVGLSVELWLVLNVFLTIWPFAPFAPFLFSMLNISVVFIVNAKVNVGRINLLPAAMLGRH